MLTRGVPLTEVSQILGHSGIAITADVYGHVAPEVSRAALDVPGDAHRPLRTAVEPADEPQIEPHCDQRPFSVDYCYTEIAS